MFLKTSLIFCTALLALTWNCGRCDEPITVAEYKAASQQLHQQLEQFNIITETLEKIRDLLDQAAQLGQEKLMEVLQSETLQTLLSFLPSYLRDWIDGYIQSLLENLSDPIAFHNVQMAVQAATLTYRDVSNRMKRI